jgi:hypothetical protein
VVREKATGMLFLWDYKVRTQLQPEDDEEVNFQFAVYQRILRVDYGVNVVGSICAQVFNELPKEPKLNQNGSMARTDIKTDWPTYSAALVANGLDPNDYLDMKDKLNGKEFWRLSKAYRKPAELEAVWNEIVLPAVKEMASTKTPMTRTMSAWNCKGCNFRNLCLEGMRGGDVDYIIANDYQPKQDATGNERTEEV